MKNQLRAHVAAAMLLAPIAATLVAQPAHAQQRAVVAAPAIHSVALNADHGLSPGSTLRFEMQATRDARAASVQLGGTNIVVPLRQTAAGVYRGSYVVRRTDQIDPTGLMMSRLTHGSTTVSRNFSYPPSFQALAMGAGPSFGGGVTAGAGPSIERFVVRPLGRLEPGRELRFRLVGAPGADAWVDIPGVISGVDLAETRPGVYEGTYTVRRRDNLDAFPRAVATLRAGSQRTTARLAREPEVARDNRPPTISDVFPANGDRVSERGQTRITARVMDEGSGIDPESARLRIDGRTVSDFRIVDNELRYRSDLDVGRHTAELTVRDNAGNSTTQAWTFDIIDRDRDARDGRDGRDRDRVSGAPLPLRLTSHNSGAVIDANGNLQLEGRTLPFASVRVQVESVASVGGLLGVTQPVMDQTVTADRDGRFQVGVNPRGLPIPGTRYDVRLTATSGNLTAEERITLHQRQG
jgi:hypothetical protein